MAGEDRRHTLMAVVLIVEDDLFILEVAEMLIQEFGYGTLSARDSDEATSFLQSPHPVDVLFTDINLRTSALGGCELARAAVKIRPKVRVLYATGNIITGTLKSMLVEGAILLTKPYTPGQLQTSLEGLTPA